MYKTVWYIKYERKGRNQEVEFNQYHFGKTPRFPSWYMEENQVYTIEMLWNIKVVFSLSAFMKCLSRQYIIR